VLDVLGHHFRKSFICFPPLFWVVEFLAFALVGKKTLLGIKRKQGFSLKKYESAHQPD
jgi:hypothetical protein